MAKKLIKYNWLPDFVYAGIDGSITTFAVVAGVVGAELSTPIILILGFANLLADGFSMAVGKFLSDRAEQDRIEYIKAEEKRSIVEKPGEEKREVEKILKGFGFEGALLSDAVKVITSNAKVWVKVMMKLEHNIIEENIKPYKGAFVTFIAFVVMGLIPLLGYMFQKQLPFDDDALFMGTCIFTLIALFIVGAVKTAFNDRSFIFSGLQTAFVGGIAASISYLVGYLLQSLL